MDFFAIAQSIRAYRKQWSCWPQPDKVAGVVECLGNGSFGCAYLLPDGRVLKVAEGLDATCVWISAAAQEFAATGAPGRCMPVVWEFSTHLEHDTVKSRELVRAESWVRLPDGSLTKVPEERKEVEHVSYKAWWFAIMEKVEAHESVSYSDQAYIESWGEARGIVHTDVYPKNCGRAHDGRLVCFDPFYCDPAQKALDVVRDARTEYTGMKSYKHTATQVREERAAIGRGSRRVFEQFKRFAFDPDWMQIPMNKFLLSEAEKQALDKAAKKCNPYLPEGVDAPKPWQALRKGPVRHGARWG